MPAPFIPAFLIGLLSAGLFLLIAALGLGFFFIFLPSLPLFHTGLGGYPRVAFLSSLVAALIIALIGGPALSVIFLLMLAFPACYISAQSLRQNNSGTWYPLGRIFLHLTVAGCVLIACMTYYYSSEPGGIMQLIAGQVQKELATVDSEMGQMLEKFAREWSFLIFSMTLWLWALCLYAHGWVANRLLAQSKKQLRPSLGFEPFAMPNWVLELLAIAAIGSLVGSPDMQFLAKATLVSLMLPYFLLGVALLHAASQSWPSRKFLLFFIYSLVFLQFWPALLLSAAGFFYHIKGLRQPENSSKS